MSLSQCDVPCPEVDFKHVMTRKQNTTNLYNGVEKKESVPISTCTMASNGWYNALIVPEHSKKYLIWRNEKKALCNNISQNKTKQTNKQNQQQQPKKTNCKAKTPQNPNRKTLAQNIL